LPASWDALLGASIEVLPLVESIEVLVVESMIVGCKKKVVVCCVVLCCVDGEGYAFDYCAK
jgi:hypothetical protein